ncbi:hypothetical protein DACRYDRAFT_116249 [Dacryopinax primogenitus]|uniref:Uncharacterized protein n=1 Tax=Dacryopinax primogenitus (strain DJM 731) TaxID=1858805 RepID=M5FZ73_DACPD|nr:uncharacterized protein DACRYDRAFT_116249 [Dacryopinax primogenitus]EJU01809.1 hypothetical protein DACRYDRAFT_116249 [Dacryopinax primogenitus]
MPIMYSNRSNTISTETRQFEDDWRVIKDVLDKTLREQLLQGHEPRFTNISYAEYIQVYSKAWNFSSRRKQRNYSPKATERTYCALSSYFFDIADKMVAYTPSSTEGDLAILVSYVKSFEPFATAAVLLVRLFRMYEDNFLRERTEAWFKQPMWPGRSPVPPGMMLVDPNPPKVTIHDGQRSVEAVPVEKLVPVPIEHAAIPEEIMRWDNATVDITHDDTHVARLLWPEGEPTLSGNGDHKLHEKDIFAARKYARLPANTFMPLVPTLLRLWRLATFKHFTSDDRPLLSMIIHRLKEAGELEQNVDSVRMMLKSFWCTGVVEQDLGFADLVDVLRSVA